MSECVCRRCTQERDASRRIELDRAGDPGFLITEEMSRMILCPVCGNKRCPRANDHRNECTGSNEPGQPGSAYE